MAMAPSGARSAISFPACPVAASSAGAGVVCRASATGNDKWWAPLPGWSGKADYLETPVPVLAAQDEAAAAARRQFVGVMTEVKARELRARMAQTELFHDAMYHTAIASRLAHSAMLLLSCRIMLWPKNL